MAIPKNSPRIVGQRICSGCSRPMRINFRSLGNGELIGVDYYCDTPGTCEYGWEDSAPYAQGLHLPYKTDADIKKEKADAAEKEAEAKRKRDIAKQNLAKANEVRQSNSDQV